MANLIRVMIAEDHALFGHGLRRVLNMEPDLEVVAEVTDGEAAIQRALDIRPDVILMDINMPKRNGLQATQDIKGAQPEVAVVVLTAYDDEEQLFFAIRAGASAYFAKDVLPDKLVNAIRDVHRGYYVIGDQVMEERELFQWLVGRLDELAIYSDTSEGSLMPLTAREMEILEHITRGASNKVIAASLGISQQTVKNHMSSILRKLSVADRTEAAVVALRRGWIRLQDTKDPPPQID
ncbi:MAG: response regulator [Anaerolineae bacterium]